MISVISIQSSRNPRRKTIARMKIRIPYFPNGSPVSVDSISSSPPSSRSTSAKQVAPRKIAKMYAVVL